ncbi:RalBP1-associated Eps domain-containing protein [Schistosoma bovis]|uniref:RalBP1-associated Eps domain-containing protein n=1 Tax=Schistosoma bovis TaxID=6184 RepID=A0A430Q8E9_SCHBO|nr:RalBP1-associated Eps domain-containing protein [Schistosoma bovis]
MEQVRHGQESWAQFDDDDNSMLISLQKRHFINQQQTMNPHFPNLGSINQNLVFPSSLSQSNELLMLKNPSDPRSSPFAAAHHRSPRSISKTVYHGNLNSHSDMNSSHCTEIQFHSHQLNNWSSFNQPTAQFKQQSNTTDITPLVITANTTTTNFSPSLNISNDGFAVRNQRIVDPWAVTSDQKAYYLSQFLRLQPDIGSKLSGLQSKTFFELSNLPSSELSKIWELSDLDHDGQLTLSEFCIAMHLVVYRLNGVPIPNNLPTVLLELVETNWLSTKLSSTSSPTVKVNTTTTATTTNELKHPHHEPNQQQQRRWSLSSQSDVSSLLASEEGMILFESKLNANAQLKHPIPLRAKTLPSNVIPELVNSMMTTPQDYSTVDHQNDFSHTYQLPYSSNNDNKFSTAISNPMIESTPRLQPQPITIHSSPILFSSQHSDSITSPSSSVIQKAPPPPPPPRANLLLVTNIDCVHNDNMGQKCGVSLIEEKEEIVPSLTTEFNSEEMKLTESQQPYITSLNNSNSDNNNNDSNNVDILKRQCDSISQINEQLTTTLIKLQQDRIALKIFLERLMPLETI